MTDRPDGPPGFDFGFATGEPVPELAALRARVAAAYRADEPETVHALAAEARLAPDVLTATQAYATRLAEAVRAERSQAGGVDALMLEFSLDSREGVALMCVAEALLRIPDAATRDRLIRDKIGGGDWRAHVGASPSLFVNAAAWGLLVTGRLVDTRSEGALEQALASLLRKGGEPLIRKGVNLAMRLLGRQFVTGRTIDEALVNAREREAKGYTYSFDMLGEAALTGADADRYFDAYQAAIHAIGRASAGRGVVAGPGVSVKLSALHPRYHRAQRERVIAELGPRLVALARLGEALRHRDRNRRRGGGPARPVARSARRARRGSVARRLGGPGLRRPVLPEARAAGDRLDRRARAAASASTDAPSRQGGVLGLRDQARAGRRDAGLPGVHAQGAHRRRVPRVREGDARGSRRALSAVREPQRVHDRRDPHARRRRALRVPVPARDGREHLRSHGDRRASSTARAGSTRRSARTRRSSPISCAGSSRTAPTRRSSTASSIRRCRSRGSSRIRWRSPRGPAARRTRTCRRRPRSCRDAGIRAASIFRTTSCCASSRASSTRRRHSTRRPRCSRAPRPAP